jgi:Helix-turn-helix domain
MPEPHPRPWHRNSIFGPGRRRPLDREGRARFRYLLNSHHRAHRLSRTTRDVGEALLRRLGTDGQCDPAQVTLAEDAACSDRTVRRAIIRLRDLGLLEWQQRLIRAGWRTEQTSSQYQLLIAGQTLLPLLGCGGQHGREIRRDSIISMPTEPHYAADVAKLALAARRAAIEARLLMKR